LTQLLEARDEQVDIFYDGKFPAQPSYEIFLRGIL